MNGYLIMCSTSRWNGTREIEKSKSMTGVSLTQIRRVGRVWLIATVLKTVDGLNHPWVQIPHSPPKPSIYCIVNSA